jgi:minimal PKS chain-length factor (CLF/KS beta)
VPVSAPSSYTGRLMAGGSALAVATALLAVRDGIAPGTAHLDDPVDAPGVELLRRPRVQPVSTVVVLARGFGGFNSSLVLRRYEGGAAA